MDNGYTSYGEEYGFGFVDRKAAKRTFSRCMLALFTYLGAAMIIIYAVQLIIMLTADETTAEKIFDSTYFLWGMQVLAMYIIAFPVFVLTLRGIPRLKKKKKGMSPDEFVIIFLISEAIMIIGSLISETITGWLSGLLGYEIENSTSEMIMDTPIWIVILVAVVIGPIFEELIFRKYLIDRLGVYGDRLAIAVSAIAFGLFHGNLSQLIYATGLGLVLGYIYTKSRDVKYSIFMHILLNFMGTVPSLLVMDSIERLESLDPNALLDAEASLQMMMDSFKVAGVSIVQYMLAIAGVILFIQMTRKRAYRIPNECVIRVPRNEIVKVTLCNLGSILFLILCIAEIVISLLPISQ